MLKINNLTKKFGEKVAVDNLSLMVEEGQICAFIGHNGAGKTTTLKCIAGIIDLHQVVEIEDNFELNNVNAYNIHVGKFKPNTIRPGSDPLKYETRAVII